MPNTKTPGYFKVVFILQIIFIFVSIGGLVAPPISALAAGIDPTPTRANPDGDLEINPITAYNFVVDSNVLSPSTYAPESAMLAGCRRDMNFHNINSPTEQKSG